MSENMSERSETRTKSASEIKEEVKSTINKIGYEYTDTSDKPDPRRSTTRRPQVKWTKVK